jgi:membrane associated rhomboid family serine protease
VSAPEALAATGDAIGRNLGNLLATWARSLFSGVVALVSVVFLVNRRYNDLALFVGASVLVGGLIFSASTVANVIRGIWTTLGA